MDKRQNLLISLSIVAVVTTVIWFFGIHPAYLRYPNIPVPEWLLTILFFIVGITGVGFRLRKRG